MKRISPVTLPSEAKKTKVYNSFAVVLNYEGEKGGSGLVDLSHLPKYELLSYHIDTNYQIFGIPEDNCGAVLSKEKAVCRLTPERALLWYFSEENSAKHQSRELNDISDGQALLFFTGRNIFSVMERIASLDISETKETGLLFVQGPVLGIPAKILVCTNQNQQPGIFFAVARGYGQSIADALLSAGSDCLLAPAGEEIFSAWLSDRGA